jgi:alkanesulfonate monooxygenase SsuD/methylene tetrahydromethanopterin reductase-like flavin-dependent oxidoreductase (luciferase family)
MLRLVRIGMNLPVMVPGLGREELRAWATRIDAGPFSSLAAGERIAFPNPEILVTLSAAALLTERVRLLFYVWVPPLHDAVLAAKQVATLDVLSGGRVVLGVGVGGREEDYRAVGAPFDRSRFARTEAAVALMRRAWAGERVFEGAGHAVEPAPLQPGGPEVLSGSLYPRSIRRAARFADGIAGFDFGPDPGRVAESFELARKAWAGAGRGAPRLVTGFWFALGPRGRDQMDAYLARYLDFLGPGVAASLAPTVRSTSAAALREALVRLEDLGTDEVILVPTTMDPDEVHRVADLLG